MREEEKCPKCGWRVCDIRLSSGVLFISIKCTRCKRIVETTFDLGSLYPIGAR